MQEKPAKSCFIVASVCCFVDPRVPNMLTFTDIDFATFTKPLVPGLPEALIDGALRAGSKENLNADYQQACVDKSDPSGSYQSRSLSHQSQMITWTKYPRFRKKARG